MPATKDTQHALYMKTECDPYDWIKIVKYAKSYQTW